MSVEPFGRMLTPQEHRIVVQHYILGEIQRLGHDHPEMTAIYAWADRHHPGWRED